MLTAFDDYPIHASAAPIAHPATGDPNHYERYWFNGLTRDGGVYFAATMGHYPVRNIIDAGFSVIKDGVERSLFASGRMPADRDTAVGPIRIEVVEPLKTIRIVADETDGLGFDLTFRHRSEPVEEPRQYRVSNAGILLTDHTRLTQWGTWEGTIVIDSDVMTLESAQTWGMRDRSWGVRPIGDQIPQNRDANVPHIFWLWAPLHFQDRAVHFVVAEEADGRRWLETGHFVPVAGGVDVPGDKLSQSYELRWKPGTRQARSATLHLDDRKGGSWRIELETLFTFYMRGIGYWHPTWGHAKNHGLLEIGREDLVLADFDPADRTGVHIQNVVRARLTGPDTGPDGIEGMGVLEQITLGPHPTAGLTGTYDMVED